jgi:hypothetical protein
MNPAIVAALNNPSAIPDFVLVSIQLLGDYTPSRASSRVAKLKRGRSPALRRLSLIAEQPGLSPSRGCAGICGDRRTGTRLQTCPNHAGTPSAPNPHRTHVLKIKRPMCAQSALLVRIPPSSLRTFISSQRRVHQHRFDLGWQRGTLRGHSGIAEKRICVRVLNPKGSMGAFAGFAVRHVQKSRDRSTDRQKKRATVSRNFRRGTDP